MTEDWNIHDLNKSTERHLDIQWDRSSSEPNLSDSNPILERWSKKFFHEYISIDELKFYRRRQPIDFHTRSNICLYDKNEPITPFDSLKTEYKRRFKKPLLLLKPSLLRKHTTLKLEGQMNTETEYTANYLPYSEEQILKCRPEHLKLYSDFEFFPEYKSSFIGHPLTESSIRIPPKETFKMENIFDNINIDKKNITSTEHMLDKTKKSTSESMLTMATTATTEKTSNLKQKLDSQKCHLKLEGEINYVPEYRSKFIEFPIEKSHSIPQLSSIKFNGTFNGIPEYRENYKFYDCYSKSAPIKKDDNINFFRGKNYVTVPEYKEKYKEPDKTVVINKTVSLKNEDNLNKTIKGDYKNIIPEYYESFKDPQIKDKPERGKCREPYLRLKGKIEFNPEYRSTYLNYPRSRPITKKSTSSIRLSNNNNNHIYKISESQSPHRKFSKSLTTSPNKYIDNIFDSTNQELPFQCQPEYRKAKREYLIKERPITRKITENDTNVKIINKNYNESNKKGVLDKKNHQNQQQQQLNKNKFSTKILTSAKKNDKNYNRKRDDISPQYRLNIENIDDFNEKFHKSSPKFGRRASVRATNHNLARDKIKIIECNPKYSSLTKTQTKKDINQITNKQKTLPPSKLSHKKHNIINNNNLVTDNDDSSFIILDEPCKKSAWMKKSWYEP